MRPLLLIALFSTGCLHRLDGWSSKAVGTPGDRPLTEVVSEALPSVVLIVSSKGDGKTTYGAGLVLGPGSLVLTNLHVLGDQKSIGVMLYAPDRVSYTPMDGGLDRFLFENQKQMIPAVVVRDDPTLDLAVIRIAADTSNYPTPRFSSEKPRRGDPVLALGHPQETVWSFTSGVVSTLHHATIQHDAAINPGSSGGPLLNARGEVVGINTSKLFSGTDGVAFARPIDLARWLIGSEADPEIDLSSPEVAATTCIRAQEIASPHLADCFDWDRRWDVVVEASKAFDGLSAALEKEGGKAGWISRNRAGVVRFVRRQAQPAPRPALPPLPSEMSGWVATRRAIDLDRARRLKEKNGMTVHLEDPAAVREVLRKGIRVDQVAHVSRDLAWVLILGRNLDGSTYRFSEAWARRGKVWVQQWPASEDQLATLPRDFPPPLDLPQETRGKLELYLTGLLYDLGGGARRAEPSPPPQGKGAAEEPMGGDLKRCCTLR
ncbi:MAG: trypsin-like peptidase domain-containing protein [Archangiaceae bacterium]|nr:trypsin-like peptidase domain-containing protein [Archangiaceae bacterium]